jgi:hypothetical protein
MKHASYSGRCLNKHPVSAEGVSPLPERCQVDEHTLRIGTVPEVFRSFRSRVADATRDCLRKVHAFIGFSLSLH